MEFVLIRKIYADVKISGTSTHPGLIDKRAFMNASPNDLKIEGEHDKLKILRKDIFNLVYQYRLDEHTNIRVVEELIEVDN